MHSRNVTFSPGGDVCGALVVFAGADFAFGRFG
jgi:hypothetical protein